MAVFSDDPFFARSAKACFGNQSKACFDLGVEMQSLLCLSKQALTLPHLSFTLASIRFLIAMINPKPINAPGGRMANRIPS